MTRTPRGHRPRPRGADGTRCRSRPAPGSTSSGSAARPSAGAALHAAAVGATVTACDAGGPDPVTGAVLAAGIPIDWRHDAAHVRGPDGRAVVDRLAVTKAITSVQPDHPELVAARDVGIVPESVQQIIADAAATGGRRLIGVTGTHGKSTTSGWLLHLLVGGRSRPVGVRRRQPAGARSPDRSAASRGSGAGRTSSSRPTSTRATSIRTGRTSPCSSRPNGTTRTSSLDEAGVVARLRRRGSRTAGPSGDRTLVANVGDPGRPARPRRARAAGTGGGSRCGSSTSAAPTRMRRRPPIGRSCRDTLVGRILGQDPDGTDLEIRGLRDPGGGAGPGPAPAHRAAHGHRRPDGRGRRARGRRRRRRHPRGPRVVRGRRPSVRAQGRGRGRDGPRRLRPPSDGDARSPSAPRGSAIPGRRLWAVYEPLTYHRTAAMLERFAEVLAEADRAAVIDIWAVRDPDTTITSAAGPRRRHQPAQPRAGRRDRQPRGRRGLAGRPRRAGRRRARDGRRPLVRRGRAARRAPAARRRASARGRGEIASARLVGRASSSVAVPDRAGVQLVAIGREARPGRQLPLPAVQRAGQDAVLDRRRTGSGRPSCAAQRRWTL